MIREPTVRVIGCLAWSAVLVTGACSSAPKAETDRAVAEKISAGMYRLGASAERSTCFADRIASTLGAGDEDEAIRIVESSNSKSDMKSGVLDASSKVRQSFIRASMSCSLVK